MQYSAALRDQVTVRHLDIVEAARMFAAIDMSVADALISVWYAKSVYGYWRPITAINLADTDGNPATTADPDWTPLLATPPYPEYPSGYNVFNAAVTYGLEILFHTRHLRLTLISTAVPGVERFYDSGRAVRRDVVDARMWNGFHFRFANIAARDIGRRLAAWTLDHYFRPIHEQQKGSASRPRRGRVGPGPGSTLASTTGSPRHTISSMEPRPEYTGELAIDLANTLQLQRDGTAADLLADQGRLDGWLRGTGGPKGVSSRRLQALREHVRALLAAAVEQRSLPPAAVTAVNRTGAAAPAVAQLEADELVIRYSASPPDAFLADVATSAITLVGGPSRDRLRRCGAPGCGRWFLASRPRQRWCSPACGNRARLARFHQHHRTA